MLRTRIAHVLLAVASLSLLGAAFVAASVPTEIQQPGTQPLEVAPLNTSANCYLCHANVQSKTEPYKNWQGSMMAHAGRDPLFWATLAVAQQDFDGSGDFCLRCHAAVGWIAGRSTPTNGSALINSDFDGVTCELCHKLTNPDDSELIGVQNAPFIANDGGHPPQAYRGTGMYVLWGGTHRLGPYSDPVTPHPWKQSKLHRSSDLCGTCHDVSNPLVGDLAHNNGAQIPLPPGQSSGVLGAPVTEKAAFKNFPYQYGVVERTYSEHYSTSLSQSSVSTYLTLPAELRSGALKAAYNSAKASTVTGDYADGTPRNFTCQSCHMRPRLGKACNLPGVPTRVDQPVHDLTGGNYWMPSAIQWLDAQARLVGGGGLTVEQKLAMNEGALRARENLTLAAALTVKGNRLEVVNLTGHKLITGYPEGRRMWLHTTWYDAANQVVRQDGEYGPITADVHGTPTQVNTLLNLNDPNTRVYWTENAMTQEWANQLLGIGTPASLVLSFDRITGAVTKTLGQLAAQAPGTAYPTFHFVLNNTVLADNRIPPYQMSYDEARVRNALPVPETQFGNPGAGGVYQHWDEFTLTPPSNAVRADIELLYQPTSWEYVQFLDRANTGGDPFLATVGADVLDAWLNTSMAAPAVLARAKWGADEPTVYCTAKTNSLGCVPSIGWYGAPSASSGLAFSVTAKNLANNRSGLLFYGGNGRAAIPFQGGILCIQPQIRRTPAQSSGGSSTGTDCSGGMNVDFNAFIGGGTDPGLTAGGVIDVQFWGRDTGFPAPNNTLLTDALEFTIGS